jgi:cell division protein FtsW (lipid II flippase)
MMFFAGCNIWHLIAVGAAGFLGGRMLIFSNPESEHMKRLTGFLDPFADPQGESYQVVQSLLALGAGGVTGSGPGGSVQKALYLPEAQNDFIFAIIGEELGFTGCIAVMIAFLILIWRCTMVAVNAPDRFSMLVASGITVMLALQVILNIAVVTSMMPTTGVTLPFISYGGNAILLFCAAMGIMLNISRMSDVEWVRRKKKKRSGKKEAADEDPVLSSGVSEQEFESGTGRAPEREPNAGQIAERKRKSDHDAERKRKSASGHSSGQERNVRPVRPAGERYMR